MKTISNPPVWRRRLSLSLMFVLMCFSIEAHGDDHQTEEEQLSPGIRLRMEGCGYVRPNNRADDDDDSADDDDDSANDDDDDSTGDDDDSTGDDDDSTGDDDDSANGDDDDSANGDDDDSANGDDDDSAGSGSRSS